MGASPTFTLDDVMRHPEFQSLSLPDKNEFLMKNVPEFAEGSPKARAELLDAIHYNPTLGENKQTLPVDWFAANSPDRSNAAGPTFSQRYLEAFGITPETIEEAKTHPTRLALKGAAQSLIMGPKAIYDYALQAGKGYDEAKNEMTQALARQFAGKGTTVQNAADAAHGLAHGVLQAVPMMGPAAEQTVSDASQGNLSAAAGTILALELQGAAGKSAFEKAGSPSSAALSEKRASNFSSALEMGGNAPKGVMVHEEVSKPIINDIRAEAARQGITPDQFKGRAGYALAAKITDANRGRFDGAYRSLIDPIDEQPASLAARRAGINTVRKMLGDAQLVDALTKSGTTNTDRLMQLGQEIYSAQTIGDLDRLRMKLNELTSAFESKPEAQQYQSPVFTKSLSKAADEIRNVLYSEVADRYQGIIDEPALRKFQRDHGAAIQADRLMQGTATAISRAASEEAAPPPFSEQSKRLSSPATYSRPIHAAGGVIQSLFRPSDVNLFNTRMARVIEGATADEGRRFPSGPPPFQQRLNPPPTPTGIIPIGPSARRAAVPQDTITSEVINPAQPTQSATPSPLPPVPKLLTAGGPTLPPTPAEPLARPEPSSPQSGAKVKPKSKRGTYEQNQFSPVGEGGEAPKPIEPRTPPAQGAATTISVPGENRTYNARYQVRELDDVIPSHNGISFSPNKDYALTNDRDYSNPVNQGKVIQSAAPGTFNASYHITDNPDATNGPPIIDSNGYVYGGNGRTMILQRVYKQGGETADHYRYMLAHRARAFGINPDDVRAMKQPILVREVPSEEFLNLQSKQNAISDFNKKGTAEMTPSERAIADSKRISQTTLDNVSYHLSESGEGGSLMSVLADKGHEIVDQLVSDGVISPQEKAAYVSRSGLTDAGKERVRKLFIGRFFSDPSQMDNTPPSVVGKLERLVGPVSKSNISPEWNLEPAVREAVDILEEMRIHGTSTVDDLLKQSSMFGESKYSPEAVAIARQLDESSKLEIARMAKKYATDAVDSQMPMGAMFGGSISPEQAFNEAFRQPKKGGPLPEVPKPRGK